MGTRIVGGKLPSCTYQTTAVQNATAASFTFSAVAIGAAGSRRYVVVAVLQAGATVTGVTIGGVTASNATGSAFDPTFYIALVPTGTTANIVVTQSASVATTMTISVWTVSDIRSATPVAASTSTASPAVLDLTVAARGVVVALAYPGAASVTFTWTGATSDFTQTSTSSNMPRNGAHAVAVGAGAPRTLRCSYSTASSPRAAAISLR